MKKLVAGFLAVQFIVLVFWVWPLLIPAESVEWTYEGGSSGLFVWVNSGNAALDSAFKDAVTGRAEELKAAYPENYVDASYKIIRSDKTFAIVEMVSRIIDVTVPEPKLFIRDEFWLRFDARYPDGGLVTRSDDLEFLRWAGD
jgi:hypothetical protein